MALYRPSHLREFLDSIGFRHRRSLSQNFLTDANILRKMIEAAELTPDDVVLDIGSGPGVFTEAISSICHVVSVEKDPRLASHLSRFPNTTAVEADFLRLDWKGMPEPTKIVSNIPYHITTPIFEKIFFSYPHLQRVVCLVQKELADRCVAKPRTKAYGALSLFFQWHCDLLDTFVVKPSSFSPPPHVYSAVIVFTKRHPISPYPLDLQVFTKKLFSQRRKTLARAWKNLFGKEIQETRRIEEISPEEILGLYYKNNR